MTDVPSNIRRAGEEAVERYTRLKREGYSHNWAEMCALQQPPGLRGTDRAVMERRNNGEWLDDMPAMQARNLLARAKKAGISTSGRYYMAGLADKRGPGDPAAWVDSASDIRRVARDRNLTVRGIVDVQGQQMPPPKSKPLSDKLVKEMAQKEIANNPNLKLKKAGEIKEMVIDKYAPRYKK
jgi:hypothetical protein